LAAAFNLRKIINAGIFNVSAVVWVVMPDYCTGCIRYPVAWIINYIGKEWYYE